MSKKKINIILYHLDQGGVERTAVNLANELAECGHDVTITTLYKHYPEKFEFNKQVKLRKTFGFYFKGLDRVIKLLPKRLLYWLTTTKDYDIEIAFQSDLPTKIIAASTNSLSKKYTWIHGIGFSYEKSYTKFDKVFFVGEDLMNFYRKKHPNSFDEAEVFYNSINKDEIIRLSKVSPKEYNENKINIIAIGRLSPEKRFDRLIKAVHLFDVKYPNEINLTILGEGDERKSLEKMINDLQISHCIHLAGFKSNPYRFLRNADLYVCSSDYEGFNVAMVEAGVLRVPIITTKVLGSTELINENHYYGQVVKNDSTSIFVALEKYYSSKIFPEKDNLVYNKIETIIETRQKCLEKYFNY